MRDFPVFSTYNGVASLTLSQIPYTAKAYIRIQNAMEPELLLSECLDFCRMAGAEFIYATGHAVCQKYPHYTDVIKMQADRLSLGETDAMLFPVTAETVSQWQKIYNDKVSRVPMGTWLDSRRMADILQDGSGYFVHQNGNLLGIGSAAGRQIHWVASVVPGAGRDVVCALTHALGDDTVFLEVASTNEKAIALYNALGFVPVDRIADWYWVNPNI